ncbi:Xaa-Pro aminopeptidase [Longilinea arvoryzae]|uniref:Xaa-Pro aminopeptidase n=1 Tax=Longilinea arvoryzae TaxID=360412 RepID=A0A0S7BED7_9CHLR|nr:Xaa-Pro peptidase family protein [Longilinea arvoryzae]GAP12758.1 Xaa-Pro aminopeptidase [Longilinea arvoryzae]
MKSPMPQSIKHDYKARILKLQAFMKSNNLDAFIVSTQDSIYYLSGASYMPVERPFFIVVHPEGVPQLVVPQLEYDHMRKVEGFGEIGSYFEYPSIEGENWYDKLNSMLGGQAVVAIEPELSVSKAALLKVKETVVSPFITEMRRIKTPDEIAAIRNAAAWTDKGMHLVHHGLYRGQSVIETTMPAKTLQTGVISSGEFDYFNCSFITAGWAAPKSAQPHSLPDMHMRMGSGPIVLMSYNRVNGYAAEVERTVFLGDPTTEERRLYDIVMQARAIAYGMVKPGVRCSDIDVATQEFFKSKGHGDRVIHRTGHGIGLGNHEQPWLSSGSQDVLAENMVISIEPALYFPEIGGFRHSDTVLVTKDGYERITQYPDDLESLIVHEKRLFLQLKGRIIRKAIHY